MTGDFAIELRAIKCGITSHTDPYGLTNSPKGQFCLVAVTVRNVSKVARQLVLGNWTLLVGNLSFPTQSSFDLEGPAFRSLFPDEEAQGTVVFDLPAHVAPTALTVQASPFDSSVVTFQLPA